MTVITRLPPPLRGPFAQPRPDMCGRYLIRNPRVVAAFTAMDAVLSLVPVRHRTMPAKVERLLLANWAHLGDVVTTLGAVRLLRERLPDAHIGMVVGSWGKVAAAATGLVDQFHVVDHWSLNRSAASSADKRARYRQTARAEVRAIAAAGYQAAIDFYPFFPPAHPLFHRAGVPVRIGFDSGGWGPLLTHRVRWPDLDRPIADHYAELIEAGWPDDSVPAGALRPRMDGSRLPPAPAPLADGAPYLVLHPGTGAPTRDWGIERWIDLIARIDRDPDPACRRIVLTGAGARDEAIARSLADAAPQVLDLAGRLDWPQFLSTLANARAIVCPDTVTSHLGAMFDTPVVCVFTGIVKPAQWGPYSDRAQLLVQAVACAPCNRWGCEAMACIRQTEAGDAMRALRTALRPLPPHRDAV